MKSESQAAHKQLPAVDRVLRAPEIVDLAEEHGRQAVTAWVRQVLGEMRIDDGDGFGTSREQTVRKVIERVLAVGERHNLNRMRPVINATGVVLHTNLGRAPLANAAKQAICDAVGCMNLEINLVDGRRGSRGSSIEELLTQLTGADAALVVNNCAAATLLALRTFATGRQVIISRGQLIEIGGSYRLPNIFIEAGAILAEVGTTNRTRLADYAAAITSETAAILRVHSSNYRIIGFTESASIGELAELARAHGLLAIDDVGSGSLYDLSPLGLTGEPIVPESLRAGADLVLFSGDKLLGGPQCGVIVGRQPLIDRLRGEPLARALRVDKLTLAALEATLLIHCRGRAFEDVPVLRQLAMHPNEIRERCEKLVHRLATDRRATAISFSVKAVESAVGGGALAGQGLPSFAICARSANIEQTARDLRLGSPSILVRTSEGTVLLDLRTVHSDDDEAVLKRLERLAAQSDCGPAAVHDDERVA